MVRSNSTKGRGNTKNALKGVANFLDGSRRVDNFYACLGVYQR